MKSKTKLSHWMRTNKGLRATNAILEQQVEAQAQLIAKLQQRTPIDLGLQRQQEEKVLASFKRKVEDLEIELARAYRALVTSQIGR